MLAAGGLAQLALAEIPQAPPAVGGGEGKPHHRRYHDPADLERKLKEQSDATFSRKWFNELLEAQDALVAKAARAKTEAQRAALEEAAETAWQTAERAEETLYTPPDLDRLVHALNAALHQERATAMMKRLHEAIRIGQELEDDEEAIELLMLYG